MEETEAGYVLGRKALIILVYLTNGSFPSTQNSSWQDMGPQLIHCSSNELADKSPEGAILPPKPAACCGWPWVRMEAMS